MFNDESVLLAVREAINETKAEMLTSEVIARAVREYLCSEKVGDVVQAALDQVDFHSSNEVCAASRKKGPQGTRSNSVRKQNA